MKVPAPITLDPASFDLASQIAALPRAGVYALGAAERPPYISWSSHLPRRLARLLVSSEKAASGPIARMRNNLQTVLCWPTGSRLETSMLLYELTQLHYPDEYLTRLRLRMPWFIGLTANDPFPRLRVANRLSRRDTSIFGPFPNRDLAQNYGEQVESLFQIRRCTEALTPDPNHPGCIYGEMNQCLRPCQRAVSAEEYGTEAARVADFLATNGKSAISVLSAARDRACEQTAFEEAAQIHKRLERVSAAAGARDDVIAEVHQFNGVALTRASERRQLRLWPMLAGLWQEPVALDFSSEEASTKSLDRQLRDRLTESLSIARTSGKRIEELAIFSRWYFSSWRDGDWFPFRTVADLNYRRLVRQISNLAKDEATPESHS